jgi:hypothetical protein
LDEAVEKDTTMASRMSRKNFSGDMPPISQITSG